MKSDWRIGFLIPNLFLSKSIEDDLNSIAIACTDDPRVSNLTQHHPNFGQFLASFKTFFGVSVKPSVLLINKEYYGSGEVSVDDLRAFRNLTALAAIFGGLANQLGARNPGSVVWSDHFDFYPVFPGDRGNYFYETPAVKGIHNANHHGQSSPRLPNPTTLSVELDVLVFDLLKVTYRKHYRRKQKIHRIRLEPLFRSLDVACSASRLPPSNMASQFEWGIIIGLWVSAFEILCRVVDPNAKQVGWKNVVELFDEVPLLTAASRLNTRRYKYIDRQKNTYKCSLLQRLYLDLYDRRNAYFHGNKLRANALYPLHRKGEMALLHIAPIIYRYALIRAVQEIPEIKRLYYSECTPMRPLMESIFENCLLRVREQIKT